MNDSIVNRMTTNMYVGSPTSTVNGDEEPCSPNALDINDMEQSSRTKSGNLKYKPMVAMSIGETNGFNGVNSVTKSN
jgi:hypothetical protein